MGEERLDDVKKEVRSVLISSKEGMSLQNFLKSYRSFLGFRFPSRQLGFTTDIELIESMPDVVCLTKDRNGSFVLTAIADKTTKHIKKLVQRQKSNKKKPTNAETYIRNNSVQNCRSSHFTERNRPFVPAKLRTDILQILKKHPDGIGYTALNLDYYKTFSEPINLEWLSTNPLERFRKLVLAVPEFEVKIVGNTEKLCLSKQFKDTVIDTSKNLDVNKNSTFQSNLLLSKHDESQEKAVISKSLQDKFEKVLKHHPKGIKAVYFPALYQELTGQTFDLHEYGYNSLLEMVDALPDIFVRVPKPGSSSDWILFHIDNAPDTNDLTSTYYKPDSEVHSKTRIPCCLKENISNDRAFSSLQYTSAEIPEEAKTVYIPICVSYIINPSDFWFQLQTNDSSLGLERLEEEMQHFYNNLPHHQYKMADVDLLVGATCAAYYPFKKHWYRVVIASMPTPDSVVVDFVDYGGSGRVPRSSLYYLKNYFINLPAQANKAQLAAVKPANNENRWARETNKRFIELCNKKYLMAQIIATENSRFSILLCDISGKDDIHINDVLVNEGYAEFHRIKNIYNTPPLLYLNTSDSSSFSDSPQPSPIPNLTHINQCIGNRTRDHCRKRLFSDESPDSAVELQSKKIVKRVISRDDYMMHILMVENKAYVSVGDLSNLFLRDERSELLLVRLNQKDVTFPTITVFRDDLPDLFEQCERFSVIDFDETKDSVTLFPLEFAPKIINILEHPSEDVRNLLIREVKHFNPKNVEWKKPFEEPEPYKKCNNYENELGRLCIHDLKVKRETYNFRRKRLLDALQETQNDNLISQVKILDVIQSYIAKRIKEIEEICIAFSKLV